MPADTVLMKEHRAGTSYKAIAAKYQLNADLPAVALVPSPKKRSAKKEDKRRVA